MKYNYLEKFFLTTVAIDVKYLKVPMPAAVNLLKKTVLRNRSEEAIRKQLRNRLK